MSFTPRVTRVPAVAIVRSALMFNPVEGVSPVDAVSFADAMVKAVNSSRTAGNSHARPPAALRVQDGSSAEGALLRAQFHSATAAQAYGKAESLPDDRERRKSADLYSRLDTLLSQQSLLIGVA